MLRKAIVTAFLFSLVIGIAWAGDAAKTSAAFTTKTDQAAATAKMKMMKDEMMKCSVCKSMASRMDELGPVMTMDYARLNDGVAMIHGVSDPTKVAALHSACAEIHTAGAASMSLTDEQAKAQLCGFCFGMRDAIKSGAKMSMGATKMGDMMVLTSSDPAVKAKIDGLATMCEMMAGSM